MDAQELHRIIHLAPYIKRLSRSVLVPWMSKPVGTEADRFTLSDTRCLDPRMPAVLDHEFNELDADDDDIVPRFVVYNALLGWAEPPVARIRGRTSIDQHESTWAINGVTALSKTDTLGWYRLSVAMFTNRTTDDGIIYARNFNEQSFWVEQAMLDTQFPDWKTRWEVAQALSLTPRAAAEMLFIEAKALPAIDMTDVSFD